MNKVVSKVVASSKRSLSRMNEKYRTIDTDQLEQIQTDGDKDANRG